ncbi:hypothetical protein CAL7716_101020 (plasmid) [Calothrix sp. PCC 7716]|nr:hypothetical protein CAL7716_101020 [Calothrix sp. PCC 7716]
MSDYREVLQNPRVAFKQIELQNATVKQTPLGLPSLVSGGFALTACLTTHNSSRWAIRCFHKKVPDLQERYKHISHFLNNINDDLFVKFEYLTDGINVRNSSYPIVKMAWVDGQSLSEYVEDNLSKPEVLIELTEQIKLISSKLRKFQAAHGDLQHGNILVRNNGRLTLIDYDGMYVPGMPYKQSNEIGHVAFQHRERDNLFFNDKIDNFSIITLYLSLFCLAHSNSKQIWQKYHTGENLIFSRKDYQDPSNSPLFSELQKNYKLAPFITKFKNICCNRIQDVPLLDDFLSNKIVLPRAQQPIQFNPLSSAVGVEEQFKVFSARKTLELVEQEGEKITVIGTIDSVVKINHCDIVFINFGNWKYPVANINQKEYKPFKVVIFSQGLSNLAKSKSLDLNELKKLEGRQFKITGLLECYQDKNGYYIPQIILEDAYQLIETSQVSINSLISVVDFKHPSTTVSPPTQTSSVTPRTKPTPPNSSSSKSNKPLPPKPAPPPQQPSSVPSQYRTYSVSTNNPNSIPTNNPSSKNTASTSAQNNNQPPTSVNKSFNTTKNITSTTSSSSKQQSDECFVVTATFGTPYAQEVFKYRHFRDTWLRQKYFGRILIHIYYYIGPLLAKLVTKSPALKKIMSLILGELAKFLPEID